MKPIGVVCSDTVFSRMLVYELKRRGLSAVESHLNGSVSLLILDLDSGAYEDSGVLKITFSYKAPADLIRPFSIDSLVELIKNKLALALTEQNEIKASIAPEYTRRSVFVGDEEISLSEHEFALFSILYENQGKQISKQELETSVWGSSGTDNRLRVYIKYLRDKLEPVYGKRIIYSARNIGYTLKMN